MSQQENKPRVAHIRSNLFFDKRWQTVDKDGYYDLVYVIEYSAYQEAQAKIAELEKFKQDWAEKDGNSPGYNLQKAKIYGEQAFEYRIKFEESKAREQKLVEALKIYADFETWNRGWDGETLPEDMAKRILKELGID